MLSKITIPAEHYVGMRKRYDSIPLAFITPNGNDKAALKRIQTVDNWTRGEAFDSTVITNEPMHGFKLTCDIRRGGRFGTGDKWYISDPRGFILEISSSNLAYLLENCVIENGVILDACIWARQRSNNVLLATNSDLYRNAVTLTNLDKTSVSMKDVEKGYTVILKSGVTAVYLGKYHVLTRSCYDDKWFGLHTPQHIFKPNDKEPKMFLYSNPKISKIVKTDEIADVDAEKAVNDHIKDDHVVDSYYPIYAAFTKKDASWKISLKPVDDINYAISSDHRNKCLLIQLKNGQYGLHNPYYRHPAYVIETVSIDEIDQGQLSWKMITKKSPKLWTNDQEEEYLDKEHLNFHLSDVENAYECYIQSTTDLGNQIEVKF